MLDNVKIEIWTGKKDIVELTSGKGQLFGVSSGGKGPAKVPVIL